MLIVGFKGIGEDELVKKYPDKVILLDFDMTNINNDILIEYIEQIKDNTMKYDVVIIPYVNEIILCLETLSISFLVVYPTEMDKTRIGNYLSEYNLFKGLATKHDNVVLKVNETLEQFLKIKFDWVTLNSNSNTKNEIVTNVTPVSVIEETPPAIDKKNLTLQELIEHDVDITEADIRDLKSTTNKFKVAMLLQAKSRLNTVLKLCNVLDKLYDELVDRIDQSLATTDTPSLMYTTDYIAKALTDTNQFIMSLITNEKIQNFFIIDNSNIINITDNRVDIDKREKIRKAAEIVLDNADYFTAGEYDKVINPNSVFEDNGKENNNNANTTT